jgi:hypothetical protein
VRGGATLMRTLGTVALCLAILIGGVVVWWHIKYPTYSYRYRLTLAIEVDGKVHTGSSVIEIIWSTGPTLGDVGPYHPSVRGQAALIDLGERGAIITALVAPSHDERGSIVWPEGVSALWLVPFAFGKGRNNDELPQLHQLSGHKDLAAENMPRLIWFANLTDPKTARRLKPSDIPSLFGSSARISAAYVEITRDPIVIDIDKKLPWYEILKRPLAQGLIQIEYGFALAKTMFIGDAS